MPRYEHLTGDLDANPALLRRLNSLAGARGERWTVESGHRTRAEQAELYAARESNPYPVAEPGTSRHETGLAADVTIGGRAIQDVIPADQLRRAGLEPLEGDAVHVELLEVGLVDEWAGSSIGDVTGAVGDAAGAVGDVAGDAAEATAKAIVGLLVDAVGDDAARIVLYPALVGAGVWLVVLGVARMVGLPVGPRAAIELALAARGRGAKARAA